MTFERTVSKHEDERRRVAREHRLWLVLCLVPLWLGVVIWRLYTLQISSDPAWRAQAPRQHQGVLTLSAARAPILDRNDKFLAVSIPVTSIYVRPKQVKDTELFIKQVTGATALTAEQVRKKISSKSPFVWLVRQLPRAEADNILSLNIPGIGAVSESRRFYPQKHAASRLLGKVGLDGNGLSGLERRYEKLLVASRVTQTIQKDALGNKLAINGNAEFEIPEGVALKTTLDADLQDIVEEELESGRRSANAKTAQAVMIDGFTGEVLALAEAPPINLNNDTIRGKDILKNGVLESVFEPGSIFKPIVTAAALEAKVVRADELIDCEKGSFRFAGHTVNDVHGSEIISVHDVVVRSSNIGMTKIGLKLGADRLASALTSFGFGRRSSLGLLGESPGIFRPRSSWAQIDIATHSYGQGIAVSQLQMVRAFSALANGGMLPNLSLVEGELSEELKAGTRIISPRVSELVRDMLEGVVVEKHGTGGNAKIEGIRVGGKTGTAQMARSDGRGYEAKAYVASFIGYADLKKDILPVLVVSITRPDTTSIYGGTLAAPVFRRIIERTIQHLLTEQ